MGNPNGVEKRRARRRPVLEGFSFFVMVPDHGIQRVKIVDVSDLGIAFDFEMDVLNAIGVTLEKKRSFDFRFYINQSVYLPLSVQVVRLEERGEFMRVGAELTKMHTKAYQAYLAFLKVIDLLLEATKVDPELAGKK